MTADAVPPPPPAPKPAPRGVIAIVTDAHGDVIATAADFDRSGYGGFKLWEAQVIRAARAARWKAIAAYAGPVLEQAITDYLAEQLWGEMRRKTGHRLSLRAIGWPDDVAAEVKGRGA